MRRPATLAADSATLEAYLQEISKFPRLAREQERELGRRIQQTHDESALNALVEGNLRFVVSYAKRYRRLGVPFLDLIHEGNLGLIEAARHFDPECGVKFITHGMWWVRQTIMHRLAEARPSALRAQLEHQPPTPEMSEDFEVLADDTRGFIPSRSDEVSLRLPRAGTRGLRHDEDFDAALCDQAIREIDDDPTRDALVRELEGALDELDDHERLVMRLRYGLHDDAPWTLRQISERLRLGGSRVRRLELRATQKLRRLQHVRGCLN